MLLISVVLLILFFIFDTFMFKREGGTVPDDGTNEPIRLEGLFNLVFLLGIIGAVLMSGTFKWGEINILGVHVYWQNIAREALIVVMGVLSLKYTPFSGELRQSNEFSWEPIEEVAKVFAGIFMTIIPSLSNSESRRKRCPGRFNWGYETTRSLFLDYRYLVQFLGQCPNIFDVLQHGTREITPDRNGCTPNSVRSINGAATSRVCKIINCYLRWRGFHGRKYLYRQCTELHGKSDCGTERYSHAKFLRIYALVSSDLIPSLCDCNVRVPVMVISYRFFVLHSIRLRADAWRHHKP